MKWDCRSSAFLYIGIYLLAFKPIGRVPKQILSTQAHHRIHMRARTGMPCHMCLLYARIYLQYFVYVPHNNLFVHIKYVLLKIFIEILLKKNLVCTQAEDDAK